MRLYPAFLICVCITHILTLNFFPSIACSTKDFLLNLTMIPDPLKAKPVDGAYWTLFVEWIYYFLIAMLLIRPSAKKTYIIMFLWLFCSIASNILYGKNPSGIPRVLNYVLVPSYSSCFISGIALWMIKGKINRYNAYGLLLLSQINAFLWYNVETLVLYGGTLIVLWLITNYDVEEIFERNSVLKVLSYYGRISYPFYLLHQRIGYILIYYLVKNGVSSVASLFITFVIITLGAHCVYVLSDRMSMSLINKISK